MTDADGAEVPASVTLDNATKSIVLHPTDLLEPDVLYTAHLGTGSRTWQGDAPGSGATWRFTTGPGSPPTVLSHTPASSAAGVLTDASLTAHFDRRLNPATVRTSTFTLRPTAGGSPVAAGVSYNAATRVARLNPSVRLSPSTSYTAELTTAIEATDGLALGSNVSWTFTTGTILRISGQVVR